MSTWGVRVINVKVAMVATIEQGEQANGAAGTRATWMGKPRGRYGREHMSQSAVSERVSIMN